MSPLQEPTATETGQARLVPKSINRLVMIVSVVEPLMTLPQIYEIWIRHQTAGVSVLTWSFYVLAACIWLIYGLYIKDKPIITTSSLWIVTEGLVVLGLLVK